MKSGYRGIGFLRNTRKTDCGAKQFPIPPVVRAATYSLLSHCPQNPEQASSARGQLTCLERGCLRALCGMLMLAVAARAQVTTASSLNGEYFFREVALQTSSGATVSQTLSGEGTLTFDGFGNYTVTGTQLSGTGAATNLSGSGTFTVNAGGFVTMSNPLLPGVNMNLRLGAEGLVGSSTEAGPNTFDLLIAIHASTEAASNRALLGPYWVSSLEFPNGGVTDIRETNFTLTANGSGSFAEDTVSGQAANLGNTQMTQTVGPITYLLGTQGSGTMNFPAASGLDVTTQLIEGMKDLYVSADGNCFIAGSSQAGGHGIIIGIKQFGGQSANSASNASWSGLYFGAGLRYDTATTAFTAVVGSVNPTSQGAVWEQRTHTSASSALTDATMLLPYSLNADGSGTYSSTQERLALASNTVVFSTTGAAGSTAYELFAGTSVLPQSQVGPLPFLNPLGVFNAASYAPPGYPVSPGGFVALFGTGLGISQQAGIPFPNFLGQTTLTVNGINAPIYAVSANQINAVVPYEVTGSTATFLATVNGAQSNPVTVPLAPTAPGVFSLSANGLGAGAITHADGTVISQSSPAQTGEIVGVYLTGLGAVSPTVGDGMAAPFKPLAMATAPVSVTVGGIPVTDIQFEGLSPGLASLYQLNIQIPANTPSGAQMISVQTADGSTDMVSVWVAGS